MLPCNPTLELCGDCAIREFQKSLLWDRQDMFAGLLYLMENFSSSDRIVKRTAQEQWE